MRQTFASYYPLTREEEEAVWTKGLVVLDTSVLLTLYDWSVAARESLLGLLEKVADRLWLPHQVGAEYHRNRLGVIKKQAKPYRDLKDAVAKIKTELDTSSHPFVSATCRKSLGDAFDLLIREADSTEKGLSTLTRNDEILDRLTTLFDGRIGPEMDHAEIDAVIKEGEVRYKRKIPPGYKDEKDKPGPEKWGDLLIWKQLLKHVAKDPKPVLFVTHERKEDWWWKIGDEIHGPHPSLRAEITLVTKQPFHLYQVDRFQELGGTRFGAPTTRAVLDEMKAQPAAVVESARGFDILIYRAGPWLDRLRDHLDPRLIRLLDKEYQAQLASDMIRMRGPPEGVDPAIWGQQETTRRDSHRIRLVQEFIEAYPSEHTAMFAQLYYQLERFGAL